MSPILAKALVGLAVVQVLVLGMMAWQLQATTTHLAELRSEAASASAASAGVQKVQVVGDVTVKTGTAPLGVEVAKSVALTVKTSAYRPLSVGIAKSVPLSVAGAKCGGFYSARAGCQVPVPVVIVQ